MKEISRVGIFACLFLAATVVLCAETAFRVKGESLTPNGDKISLEWQVESRDNSYVFYLNNRKKAEMLMADGKVVKIRRCVRFAGKDKWIVLKDPFQITLELKSGFYPFSAVLNYRNKNSRETVMATGRFEIVGNKVQ